MPDYSKTIHILRKELRELRKKRKSLISDGTIVDSAQEIDKEIMEKSRRKMCKENENYELDSQAESIKRGPTH